MRRAGYNIRIGNGARVNSGRDKAADVRHIDHEVRSYLIGYLAHFLKIYHARIRAGSGNYELGLTLAGRLHSFFVVDHLCFGVDTVEAGVKILAGYRGLRAVRQVAAVTEIHTEYGIARLQKSKVDSDVCLRAGVRLNIGVLGSEELLCPVYGELLDDINILAAAVVSRTGIALGVFIGQVASHGLHNGAAGEVFGRYQLDVVALTLQLLFHCAVQLGVAFFNCLVAHLSGLP